MANKSKDKGSRFEREIVKICKFWEIKAQRCWGSDGRSMGFAKEVDVVIDDDYKIQAKIRKKLPNWIYPTKDVDAQVVREDRGIPYIILPLEDWLADRKALKEKKWIAPIILNI